MESGHTPSRKHPEYWGGEIPWISIGDARLNHGRTIKTTIETTNELGIANSSSRVLPKGTVCLSRTASVGYVVVMGRDMATSQDFVNWVCSPSLDPRFLQYLFLAEGKDILRFASGSVHQTIYFPEAKAFHICYPPLREQRRIVGILDEAFAGIATAKANTEKNLRNARDLLPSHLHDYFAGNWQERALEDVVEPSCTLSYGIVQPGEEYPNGLPIVRPTDLTQKTIPVQGLKRVDPELAAGFKRTTLVGDELLLCVRGSTGVVSIAAQELKGANVTRGIVPIRFKSSDLLREFGYYVFRSSAVQAQIRARTYGTALMQINIRDLRKIRIACPPIAEQTVAVRRLSALDAKSRQLESLYQQKLAALDGLKTSLLHQAFSGQLSGERQALAGAPL